MSNRFASGKNAIAECDRCGQRFMLKQLRREIIKTKNYDLLVCNECWDPDHPQLQLGMYPVDDPQGLRNPRPDRSYVTSGLLADGSLGEGSRIIQWGWNPVGGASANDAGLTPNNLVLQVQIGSVAITVNEYTYKINYSAVVTGLLQAATNTEPAKTLFKTTTISGRPLGDITNDGTVNSADSLAYNRWRLGTQSDLTYISYIENVLNPYIVAHPTEYAAYLVSL